MPMKFNLSINGGFTADISEDFDDEDIIKLLEFDENDIEGLLRTHAAKQAYWEALAIKYKNRYEAFKDDWAKKWWAYNKVYSRYVLIAYGEKSPTLEALKDYTVLIYSQDTSDFERKKYASIAHSVASRNKLYFDGDEAQFFNLMFKHVLSDIPWYFETVTSTLKSLKEQADLITTVAEKLNSRSFHMNGLLTLLTAKQANIGPRSYSEKDLVNAINKSGV